MRDRDWEIERHGKKERRQRELMALEMPVAWALELIFEK